MLNLFSKLTLNGYKGYLGIAIWALSLSIQAFPQVPLLQVIHTILQEINSNGVVYAERIGELLMATGYLHAKVKAQS